MEAESQIKKLLSEHNCTLVRDTNHPVWKLPNGNLFVMSKTPSDTRSMLNGLSDLRRELGIHDPERGQEGERREKRNKPGRAKVSRGAPCVNTTFAEQLSKSGTIEMALREQIEMMQSALNDSNDIVRLRNSQLADLRQELEGVWGYRLRKWARLLWSEGLGLRRKR